MEENKVPDSLLTPEMSGEHPTAEELAVLTPQERRFFLFVHAMNKLPKKRFWTRCQEIFGRGWIDLCTYNLMRLYGLPNLNAIDPQRPLLIVANHRSFFDMYVVSAMIYKHTHWPKQLYFPVRARFFYQSWIGMLVNLVMGLWSMYPPFFHDPQKKLFDQFSTRLLTHLCQVGPGNIIGFHPEGTRNKSADPYSYLPAQPGVGKIIKEAQPQVMPVFVAGLRPDNLLQQVLSNWLGGPPIRIHFGACLDLQEFYAMKNQLRTYKLLSDHVMAKVAELGEQDRAIYAPETQSTLNSTPAALATSATGTNSSTPISAVNSVSAVTATSATTLTAPVNSTTSANSVNSVSSVSSSSEGNRR
jgi:1-acyl-sn-glycerol-3-phosphate acyltransferase